MAILTRVKISPQQRYDLEDFFATQGAARTDAKLNTQKFMSELNLVMNGFSVSGIGLNSATVGMANASFIFPQNTTDFSYFISAPAEPDVIITDADLADGVRNYVEIALTTQDGTPLTKAFWDPEANSGAGAEFNQIVNTVTDLKASFVVSTGGFSGSPDRLPIAIIDTDGSGVIKVILDRRNLYGRLAKPNDLDNQYVWGTKVDPVYTLVMSAETGTFVAGETITIGGETATVVTGGTTSITFNEPTGINFFNGNSVLGGTSGATGTVNTVFENFLGVDKSLKGQKMINDAIMTEIKILKNTRFWWQTSATLGGLKNEVMSTIAPISSGAKVKWNGSALVITDNSLTPALTDNVAAIRAFNSTTNLFLRRQDDGKEVVTITLSDIPTSGTLTLNQNGNLTAIAWNDSTATIQTTWNGSGSFAATITGSPASKVITITANAAGAQVDVITSSNTLAKAGSAVTPSYSIKQGMAADGSISIADGQVLYVSLPSPLANTNYSGVGTGATNYKVAARGSPALNDATYWLAYREGSKLIWRFAGELASGESSEISDNVPQSLLDNIGLASETSAPSYSSSIRGVVDESIVKRVGVLTDAVGDEQEDRSGYLRSDDTVSWDGAQLTFTQDIVLEFVNTKTGTLHKHKVLAANSPIAVANGESIWVLIDRTNVNETLTYHNSGSLAIPAQTQPNKEVFVFFRRVDALGVQYLHIPFHKQIIAPGQTVHLGAGPTSTTEGIPNISVTSQAELIAAIATLTNGGVILIASPFSISTDVTVTSKILLQGRLGFSVLTVATGGRLILNDEARIRDLELANSKTSGELVLASGNKTQIETCRFTLNSADSVTGVKWTGSMNDVRFTIFSGVVGGSAVAIEAFSGTDNEDFYNKFE